MSRHLSVHLLKTSVSEQHERLDKNKSQTGRHENKGSKSLLFAQTIDTKSELILLVVAATPEMILEGFVDG